MNPQPQISLPLTISSPTDTPLHPSATQTNDTPINPSSASPLSWPMMSFAAPTPTSTPPPPNLPPNFFSIPTFDMGSSNHSSRHAKLVAGLQGYNPFNFPAASSATASALTAANVTNLVTIRLNSVEDYLTWKTQFSAPLISHNLLGFVDGTIPPPPPTILDEQGKPIFNPNY